MSGTIYFGAPPKDASTIATELSSRGINLIRSSPSQAFPIVHREVTSPNYALYIAHFPLAVDAAVGNKYKTFGPNAKFYTGALPDRVSSFMRSPPIIWNGPTKKKEKTVLDF
jgi:hypothetical protein